MPFALLITIIASIFLHPIIPPDAKSIIYALSLTIKSIILFALPFIIFGLLFKTFVRLSNQAVGIFFLIFGSLCVSNFLNTFIAHYVGSLIYHSDFSLREVYGNANLLEPYFVFLIPNLIKNEIALFGGVIAGLTLAAYNRKLALMISQKIDALVQNLLSVISFLIPVFIAGFVLKCASDGNLGAIVKHYSQILLVFVVYATVHTFIFFLLACRFSLGSCLSCLKNMIPAWLTAMSTASSVLSMPVTILSAEKNAKNKELTGSIISSTVNIHLLGDCLAIPLLAYAVLKNHGFAEPSLYSYFIFTIFFVIAKFSVAAVPAGGIIVMVPILEKYLNFTTEMSTFIITLYVIFDPIITGFNILGNGALAKFIDNCKARSSKLPELPTGS